MLGLLFNIANITGGILLGLVLLDKWDGEKDFFKNIASKLAPFQTLIGGFLVVLSVLFLFRSGGFIKELVSLIGGFLLLTHTISKAPAFKESLLTLSEKLMRAIFLPSRTFV